LGGSEDVGATLIWVAVCFVSILLHEFGHVAAFRFFGVKSDVLLYAYGGLASPSRDVRGTFARVFVSVAGPGGRIFPGRPDGSVRDRRRRQVSFLICDDRDPERRRLHPTRRNPVLERSARRFASHQPVLGTRQSTADLSPRWRPSRTGDLRTKRPDSGTA